MVFINLLQVSERFLFIIMWIILTNIHQLVILQEQQLQHTTIRNTIPFVMLIVSLT